MLKQRFRVYYQTTKYVEQTQNKLTELRKSNLFMMIVSGALLLDACVK